MLGYAMKDIPRRDKAANGNLIEGEVVESYATKNYVYIKAKCCINGMQIMYSDRYSGSSDFLEKSDSLIHINRTRLKPGQKITIKYREDDLSIFMFIV